MTLALHGPIPQLTPDQWAQQLMRTFPGQWTSDQAKNQGGVLYSLFKAFGNPYNDLNQDIVYGQDAARIATAEGPALDAVAADFYAPVLGFPQDIQRSSPSEPDSVLRQRIQASLFVEQATKRAMFNLIEQLTDAVPRIIEPWNTGDTGAIDSVSYLDIDTPSNPARVGNSGYRYTGFVESVLPPFTNAGPNIPIYCLDSGACLDTATGYLFASEDTWYLGAQELDQLINKIKPVGTVVYRRYLSQALINYPLSATRNIPPGSPHFEIDIAPPFTGYVSVLASANWNTAIGWGSLNNNKVILDFSVAAPVGAQVDILMAPITVAGYNFIVMPFEALAVSVAILSEVSGYTFIATPSWDANAWVSALSSGSVTTTFNTPAPPGSYLSYVFFKPENSGNISVPANSYQVTLTPPSQPYQIFAMPTWNTAVEITKGASEITFSFGTPPNADATLYWGVALSS
jgi:hypothetical protein